MLPAQFVSKLQTHTPGSRCNSGLIQLFNVLPFQGEAIVLYMERVGRLIVTYQFVYI